MLKVEVDINRIPGCLLNLVDTLQKMSFCDSISKNKIDKKTCKHLYTSFLNTYQPHITGLTSVRLKNIGFHNIFCFFLGDDGNCLWNMTSISLCGSQILQPLLRKLTVFTIIIFKTTFENILRTEYDDYNKNPTALQLKLEDILIRAKTDTKWGNEYHLLALSTLLNKNVYIYSEFLKKGKFIIRKSTNEQNLKAEFNRIGLNLIYEPIDNTILRRSNSKISNIFGYYRNNHYVSLIPKSLDAYIFPIKNNFFKF